MKQKRKRSLSITVLMNTEIKCEWHDFRPSLYSSFTVLVRHAWLCCTVFQGSNINTGCRKVVRDSKGIKHWISLSSINWPIFTFAALNLSSFLTNIFCQHSNYFSSCTHLPLNYFSLENRSRYAKLKKSQLSKILILLTLEQTLMNCTPMFCSSILYFLSYLKLTTSSCLPNIS